MQDRQEPRLAVRPLPVAWFLRRRFLRMFVPVASLAVVGLVALYLFASLLLPFERVVTLEGGMGSKAEFFEDRRVQELLVGHHMRVHVTRQGSRELATGDLSLFDFVFPSGQPSAEVIKGRLRKDHQGYGENNPFISPIVLATYREYAEALVSNKVATPLAHISGQPYIYKLDMNKFLALGSSGTSWNQLERNKITSENVILAQTGSVCEDNATDTYLGLVSYVFEHKDKLRGALPSDNDEANRFANDIKPLLRAQGLPLNDPWGTYLALNGRQIAPIVVVYEHQYLAHQLEQLKQSHNLDSDRVLLYPDRVFETQPEFIPLKEPAKPLGILLENNRDLRRRAVELGFQVSGQKSLSEFLAEQHAPEPPTDIKTRAMLPDISLLETMIEVVGSCPQVPK